MRILKEAFSPSMPKWLKEALLAGKGHSTKFNYQDIKSRAAQQGMDIDQIRYYTARKKGGWGNYNLWDEFRAANINLDTATFEQMQVPSSIRDIHLKQPYVPIFKLPYDKHYPDYHVVYAKGINDDVEVDGKKASYYSMKALLEMATAFCCIDMSDPDNLISLDKRTSRNEWKQDRLQSDRFKDTVDAQDALREVQPYGRVVQSDSNYLPHNAWTRDASGYITPPDRFAQKLRELRLNKSAKIMEDVYADLVSIKNAIAEYISDSDFPLDSRLSRYLEALNSAINSYNTIISNLDVLKQNNSDDARRMAGYYLGDPLENLQEEIKRLKEVPIISSATSVIADWEEFVD